MESIALSEEFKIFQLNKANYTLGVYKVSLGGLSASPTRIKKDKNNAFERISPLCEALRHNSA